MGTDWLASGGAFFVLGIGWLVILLVAVIAGVLLGKRYGAPQDGCLIGFLNIILSIVAGCVGLLAPGRAALPACLGAAFVVPAIATLLWARKIRPRR